MITRTALFCWIAAALLLVQCNSSSSGKNEVFVMGAIHQQHQKSTLYSTTVMKDIIRKIKPDVVFTEIPPDRLEQAKKEFAENGKIVELRVTMFPEYVDVLFPLTEEMDFEIVGTSAWTKPMADQRRITMRQLRMDSTWKQRFADLKTANQRSDSVIKLQGQRDDPKVIHTDAYDAAVEIWSSTYNELFNEALGDGGWENINEAHFKLISAALDERKNQGQKILIIFGAGHKGWIMNKLRERDDITVGDMQPYLE